MPAKRFTTANSSRDQLGYRPYAVWLVLAVVSRVREVCCIFYAPMPGHLRAHLPQPSGDVQIV